MEAHDENDDSPTGESPAGESPAGGTTRRTWTGDVVHTQGTPRGADRTAGRNVVDLACLGGLSLSILLLFLGVADAAGLSPGFSLGWAGPGAAVLILAAVTWSRRSRRA